MLENNICWAVKYGAHFSVYNSELVALKVAKSFGTNVIKVRGVGNAAGVSYARLLGRIGTQWYLRCDNG